MDSGAFCLNINSVVETINYILTTKLILNYAVDREKLKHYQGLVTSYYVNYQIEKFMTIKYFNISRFSKLITIPILR